MVLLSGSYHASASCYIYLWNYVTKKKKRIGDSDGYALFDMEFTLIRVLPIRVMGCGFQSSQNKVATVPLD